MAAVKQDVFPAFVAILEAADPTLYTDMTSAPLFPKNARQIIKSRIVVYADHVTVAVDGPSGPKIVFDEDIVPSSLIKTSSGGQTDSYLTTVSGIKLAYRKDMNCGCGSRLRSWNPYRHLYSTKDPTE